MPKQVKVLRVVAKREGFRRAGMEFGAVPKNLPLEELPDHAHQAIKSDPALVTFEVVMHELEDGTLVEVPQPDVADLDKRKAELEKQAAALKQREADLDAREAALQAREDALAKAEKAQAAPKATK
ncbi:hypothetical protein [Ralstonia mannitolilytica]|uniref:hypothetical protein n=1 Tax=Ralstonia mannitolilytica TaxID=105219 RepID=UPI0028F5FE96|nr:hypothetical protein [Ralstonia mannitolilytica]CAJ0858366.1 hypothetical protein R76727_01250 [Ralstonia mannitolilytica]